ncbi:hypothetical protein [Paenibacillus qinlingensis]|uniref:Uncharacterized protein n=1 Tax=Paenibacillus qinlingensis TaxID=1837343 RepID=A0ABU1P6T4_9BACL|nr:hypothetical protein [Paenibacillus qinlingensis]MDR6555478.1 hypothetical protein [Paenibacillus qinlingensis]
MSENMDLYEKVRRVPENALKPIVGGRLKGMSDINPMWRIKMLTEMFGICGIGWRIEIVDQRIERGSGEEIVCFVDINLYIKSDGEWSYPIPGMGGSSFVTQEQRGPYTSDECFKMAYTDAISVACKSLGFAADVYFEKDRTKYTDKQDTKAPTKPVETPKEQEQPNTPQPVKIVSDGGQNTHKLISEGQVKLVGTLKSRKKISEEDFRRILAEHSNGNTETKKLTMTQAIALINFLTAYEVA